MKVLTVLAPSPFSLCESATDRSVTLSVHTASRFCQRGGKESEYYCAHANRRLQKSQRFISPYLSSTQADVELVEIFGSFRGEARTVHQ